MELIFKQHNLTIFLVLATLKGMVEAYAGWRQNKGGIESSQNISRFFIAFGVLTPVLILLEIILLEHALPLTISLGMATVAIVLMVLRMVCVRILDRYYSVNIRIADDHKLIKTGVYRYFRHPLYLIGLLENFFYPMASGAYLTSIFLFVMGNPLILLRRRQEEAALQEKFGQEYVDYKKNTWF